MKLSDEHLLLKDTVRKRLAEPDIKAMIRKYERHGQEPALFAWEWVHAMAEFGLTAINVPEEYGGAEIDNLSGVIAMIEMARAWSGGSLILAVGNSLVSYPLAKFGNEGQKEAYLPRLASGKILGSFGLTEPGNGSDAGGIKTFAEKIAGGWQVSGQKQFITNTPIAEFIILFARTNRNESGYKGITAFLSHLLRPTPPSLVIPLPDHKLGNHAAHMGKIFFDNYHLFESNLFGEEGKGFKVAMATLAHGRNWIAAQGIGLMEHAMALALDYAQTRTTFGETLIKHSNIYNIVSELALAIDVSKILLFYSAKLEDEGKEFYPYASCAKLYSSEKACELIQKANKIFGGSGYIAEMEIAALILDSLVLPIYEGPSNVQKDIILKAWFEDKLPLPGYVEYFELIEQKRKAKEHMKDAGFLKLYDQEFPDKIAGILPLIAARDLLGREFSEDWPKEFMNFGQDILKALIFDEIRRNWPSSKIIRTRHVWESAKEHLLKNR